MVNKEMFLKYEEMRMSGKYNMIMDGSKVMEELKIGARDYTDILRNTYESGFPYLLTVPAYILMLFAIIFPVVITILFYFFRKTE